MEANPRERILQINGGPGLDDTIRKWEQEVSHWCVTKATYGRAPLRVERDIHWFGGRVSSVTWYAVYA